MERRLKEVKLVIKMQLTEEKFNSVEFQEFLEYIQAGGLLKDMSDDELFIAIKIYYFLNERKDRRVLE